MLTSGDTCSASESIRVKQLREPLCTEAPASGSFTSPHALNPKHAHNRGRLDGRQTSRRHWPRTVARRPTLCGPEDRAATHNFRGLWQSFAPRPA
eukprot:scaffold4590_cov389-Prasinococcus_capsulatus_cf.AAC.6